MSTSRRDFLKKSSMVALAAAVPASLVRGVSGKELVGSVRPASELTKAAFHAQLNTQFRIHYDKRQTLVKLVEVADLAHRKGSRSGKEGFSLLFRGSQSSALRQNTYRIDHDELGSFSFLIVPVPGKNKNVICYEAVVNRLYP